ncbi:MAG: DNA-directed RNA polymerase subunit beta [Erysipelotrichaceae bacterium]|jgi:DNA-directed RNA polymerase subunit beta|nr:DNA-directed RNA polymerase subunit beta [Erysipelotrichaceae bacterium]
MTRDITKLRKLNNDRVDFSRISGTLPLPNLVEIQTGSYKEFKEQGLDEVFKEAFPISNYSGSLTIDYSKVEFGQPKHSFLECKARDLTYSVPLNVTLRLRSKENEHMQETSVYMGDLPLMTSSGTFIINGAERVIVSQLVRSPGAYLSVEQDPKSGLKTFGADLIPGRGTWFQFGFEPKKEVFFARIDRQRKMSAGTILKALGFENDQEIVDVFGDRSSILATLDANKDIKNSSDALVDIFRKMKPGEPVTRDGTINFLIQKFFDDKRYDLGRAGRHKIEMKLGIYSRLPGLYLAENLVSADGEVVLKKGELLTKEFVQGLKDEDFFEKGAHTRVLKINRNLDDHGLVNIVKVYTNDKKDTITSVIGTGLIEEPLEGDTEFRRLNIKRITIADIVALFNYLLNLMDGIAVTDDIDHLGNRRVRRVGELIQNQFRVGLSKMAKAVQQKMSISDAEESNLKKLINPRPLTASIREFFASSQLSQFMDQTNPLAELTNKRRLSALGPGGLTRDRASTEVRDVHVSHYGRICPIETPEGQNIGLINNLATYAKVNDYGFIETPYRHVKHDEDGRAFVLDGEENTEYLDASREWEYIIAEANINLGPNEEILDDTVVARHRGENIIARKEDVDFVDVSPKQIVSIAAACIPFLENDDTTRALMGANMQRQALPLLRPHAPFVGTGLEHQIARDSGLAVVAVADGEVVYVDSRVIKVKEKGVKELRVYTLQKFDRSNQGTCINQKSIVKIGDNIKKGDVIADGPAMQNGDLALGQNITIAFMTWNGYNYEDAVIMSEKLVKEDTYTSIHIEKYELECRETKLGDEEITRDIPNVGEDAKKFLDERGIIVPGAEVKEGDILVGKVTPKGQTEPTPEEKLLMAIFAEKTKEGKDASLRVPHGGAGIVLDVKIFKRSKDSGLPPGVNEVVRVYIVQKRKISEGDKMSGRHGNKGVISKILPIEDMPFLPDGTPIDVMLNPLGVPSRMNIGQILEVHLGMALKKLGYKIATPVFDGITNDEIFKLLKDAGMAEDGKTVLYDGRTGERFDERITVGVMYMIKLVHMVDDKLHARATGPYSLVTQQPLGGKAQNGGQKFGEMEVWALEAYGAAHVLQEMLTIKSDDRVGRRKSYEAIIKGTKMPKPSIPEAFKVLVKELQALSMDVELLDKEGNDIDLAALAKETLKEERKIDSSIRAMTSETALDAEDVGMVSESADTDED